MRAISIATSDARSNLITSTAVDKTFKTKPHRFGATRNDPSLNELINGRCKLVLYSRHQLSHTSSIGIRIARCYAHSRIAENATRVGARNGTGASVLSDNGMYFTARFASGGQSGPNQIQTLLAEVGIKQKHSRPNHPTTCGKVERFQQTLKKWLRPKPPANTINELQTLLDAFVDEYNHRRPHRSLGRTTPHLAYARLPKTGPATAPETEHRVRRDKVDNSGKVTLRHNTHLYKIGIGRAHAGTPIIMLITGLEIRIVATQTGELLRRLTLNTDRTYQPTGKPRNPPN